MKSVVITLVAMVLAVVAFLDFSMATIHEAEAEVLESGPGYSDVNLFVEWGFHVATLNKQFPKPYTFKLTVYRNYFTKFERYSY